MESDSLEKVEDEQKRFEQFQTEMKSNEEKLKKLNEVAEKLQDIGQTEAAEKIIQQIETLNTQWSHLEQTATEKAQVLVSSHEVHIMIWRFVILNEHDFIFVYIGLLPSGSHQSHSVVSLVQHLLLIFFILKSICHFNLLLGKLIIVQQYFHMNNFIYIY